MAFIEFVLSGHEGVENCLEKRLENASIIWPVANQRREGLWWGVSGKIAVFMCGLKTF